MKHEVRSYMGEESSAPKREWPFLRKCPGISAPGQQQAGFTVFASKDTASNTVFLETMKSQSVSSTWTPQRCPSDSGSALSLRQGDVTGPAS